MCGGFTHCPGHLGSRQAVLRRGDAVRQRLTRHLLSEEINLDFQASNMVLPPHTHTHSPTRPQYSQLPSEAPENRTQIKEARNSLVATVGPECVSIKKA